MSRFLNDDILYYVLQYATESSPHEPSTHRAQREALYKYALVSRMWSRTAQSLLFRHAFLQIRTAMLALLEVVDHKTERGRRLASYVRVATIKLSRSKESEDPPSLPMIHPRHLPALLAHLPSLHELRLALGETLFGEKELYALLKSPSPIRVLRLSINTRPWLVKSDEISRVVGLWSNLQSLVLEVPFERPANLPPPPFALREFHDLTYFRSDSSATAQWILTNSVGVLEHCTLSTVFSALDLRTAISEHVGTIRSLTLGQVQWDKEVCDALRSFTNLTELRIVNSIFAMGSPFPEDLPNTLQHLAFVVPTYMETPPSRINLFKYAIPTQLKTYTIMYHELSTDRRNNYTRFTTWVKGYEHVCRQMGVDVRLVLLPTPCPGGELGFSSN
jgi:hypothetical protein